MQAVQSFELLFSPTAPLCHPQLRKTCSKRAFPRPRAHMHTHGASERVATHTCPTEMLASTPPELTGTCAAAPAPRPRRPAGQRLSLHLGGPGSAGGAHLCTAGPGGPRSRGVVPSIGLAAGARIPQAPALPPAPAPGTARRQNCAGHGARFFHATAACAGARRFNRARAHIPGTEHDSPGGRPCAPHAASAGLRAYN